MAFYKTFIKGSLWQAIGRYSGLIIQLVVMIILSRILEPEDFGTIGLLTVFIAISKILVDSGFCEALIQKKQVNDIDYNSVFLFNVVFSLLLYLILFFASTLISNFYEIPELTSYSRYIFLVIPINAISLIQGTMLTKKLEFKYLSIIDTLSSLLSAIFAITAAYCGYGIWSLVVLAISSAATRSFLLIVFNRWKPSFSFSRKSIVSILPFSINLLLTSLINVIFQNIYTLIIGKVYTKQEIGFYNQSKKVTELSGNTIVEIVKGVSFPMLAKEKENINEIKHNYINIIKITVILVVPVMFALILTGKELFILLFTEKWLPAIPFLILLCIYDITLPLHLINGNVLKIYGDSKKILLIEILRRLFLIVSIILTINISVSALLVGQIVATIPIILISMIFSGKYLKYSVFEQIKDIGLYYIIGLSAYIIAFYCTHNILINLFGLILIKFCIFFFAYLSLLLIFDRKINYLIKYVLNKRNLR